MGKGKGKKKTKKKKTYTKAQQLAKKRIAAKKESTKTSGGNTTTTNNKTISTSEQVKKDNKRYGNTVPSGSFGISQAGKDKAAINKGIAAARKTGIPSGKNLKSGSFGISQAGKKQAAANRASVKKSSGPKFKEETKVASAFSAGSGLFGDDIDVGDGVFRTKDQIIKMRDNPQNFNLEPGSRLLKQIQEAGKGLVNTVVGGPAVAAEGNVTGLGISPAATTPSYFSIKSPESFGAPSQEAVDKAAGITAGGLNIGGSGFTPDKPSTTSRAIADPTASGLSIQEKARRRDAIFKETGVQTYGGTRDVYGYSKSELDKLRNFSDKSGLSFGSVIGQKGTNYPGQLGVSEEEIALNNAFNYRDDGLVMNSIGQFVTPEQRAIDDADAGPSVGRSLATGFNNIVDRIPIVGKRLPNLKTDYTRAEQNLLTKTTPFKGGSRTKTGAVNRRGGGARLPVAPMTPQEILEGAAVGQTVPDYQQAPVAQTGVDSNRLMQIQQDAYLQAFNPSYNPMFRFFNRRGGARRGAFRKAFRRN